MCVSAPLISAPNGAPLGFLPRSVDRFVGHPTANSSFVPSQPLFRKRHHQVFMNRMQSLDERPLALARGKAARPARSYTCASDCHFYVAPLHYEPNYSYPLVVWLHGPHNNENQLKQIMPLVSLRNYVGAAPRATAASEHDDGARIKFCWRPDEAHVQLAEERLWECIDGARRRFNLAAERIFLAGLEDGGTMALRLALRNPGQFAGALSFGGAFPADRAPLARLHAVRRLPLFFATTWESVLYPQARLCEDLRLFHSAGLAVTVRHYRGEDGLTKLMLADMDRWIMEHITRASFHAKDDLIEHRSAN
jgi:phospholipase/carboxylesterase